MLPSDSSLLLFSDCKYSDKRFLCTSVVYRVKLRFQDFSQIQTWLQVFHSLFILLTKFNLPAVQNRFTLNSYRSYWSLYLSNEIEEVLQILKRSSKCCWFFFHQALVTFFQGFYFSKNQLTPFRKTSRRAEHIDVWIIMFFKIDSTALIWSIKSISWVKNWHILTNLYDDDVLMSNMIIQRTFFSS